MTNEAAFKAVYSDFKLVKTRGVVQIILEVPIEQSSAALEALGGMPSQAEAMWCGVARLSQQGAAQPQPVTPTIHPTPAGAVAKSYAQRIAILCQEVKFRTFLRERNIRYDDLPVICVDGAAEAIRQYCDVKSRSEIREGTVAGNRWQLLHGSYLAWDEAPRAGAA